MVKFKSLKKNWIGWDLAFWFKFAIVSHSVLCFSILGYAYDFGYQGRLTEPNGKPVKGPVDLKVSFFADSSGGNVLHTQMLGGVELQDGMFQVVLSMSHGDYHNVFSSADRSVWVEVTDMTHSKDKPYPRQRIGMLPFAGKVPVDDATLMFSSEGKLTLKTMDKIQGRSVSSQAPTTGQVLQWDGNSWTPTTPSTTSEVAQDIRTTATPTFNGIDGGSGTIKGAALVAGTGDGTGSAAGGSFRSANKTGADAIGRDLTIAAGNGTGSGGSGSILFQTAPVAGSSSTANTMTNRMAIDKSGNVGIGTTTPLAKLYVDSGQIVSKQNYDSTAGVNTVDFNLGNVAILDNVSGSAITLNNMVDGGAYTLIIRDPTSRSYTFTNCTNSRYNPINGPTSAGTHSVYTIIKATISSATWCYISWMTDM